MEPWPLNPIARVQSPFQEKFGIPRQSGLTQIQARVELCPDRVQPCALDGLRAASHLWLIFGFHALAPVQQAKTVRPPRLGGNTRCGVYATRSPFRPNRLGLSLVELVSIDAQVLVVRGADLLNGTPVFDIKPYLPYCDQPEQSSHWAMDPPEPLEVRPSPQLTRSLEQDPLRRRLWLQIADYLRWDPRPPYRATPDPHIYRQRFEDHEVQFRRDERGILVQSIETAPQDLA